ncbi:MAG: TPR end-of-group domain-containing protein, partial [Phycisphaerales bacterium JB064]
MRPLFLLCVLVLSAACVAQEPIRLSDAQLQTEAYALATDGDFEAALPLFQEMARRDPESFVPQYNIASALSQLGRADEALDALDRALQLGFDDLAHLRHDPDLHPIRETERFQNILETWPQRMEGLAEARFDALVKRFGGGYHTEEDAFLRLRFAVGLPEQSFAMARAELDMTSRWAVAELFGNLVEADEASVPWVSVAVPTDADFARWASMRHGEAARGATRQIAGTYDHDRKELVCKDLGATLRHEVFHAMHYRSQSLEGQRHASWIMEGLASLVEDFDPQPDGTPAYAPSWRTNLVKKAHDGNGLKTLQQLAETPDHLFVGSSQLLHYGHARAIMLYLVAADKLGAFYENYVDTWERDRTGVQALERTFAAEIDQIDVSFGRWLERLPVAPEQHHPPMATLGIDVDGERGEGLAVLRTVRGSPGQRAGVRQRDVLVAINGQGTRDLNELYRVVGRYVPGDTVILSVRRGRQMLELPARLGSRRDFDTVR